LLVLVAACGSTKPAKEASARMEQPTKTEWAGPTQLAEGVSVVSSAAAWDALRARWGEPLAAKAQFTVDWSRDVILVVAGPETGETGRTVSVARLVRGADAVEIDVVFEGPGAAVSFMNHPAAFVSAPAATFADDPPITLRWDGKPWAAPATYER